MTTKESLSLLDVTIDRAKDINNIGTNTLADLQQQKDKIVSITDDVDNMNNTVDDSGWILSKININMKKHTLILIAIILLLFVVIGILLYFKFHH